MFVLLSSSHNSHGPLPPLPNAGRGHGGPFTLPLLSTHGPSGSLVGGGLFLLHSAIQSRYLCSVMSGIKLDLDVAVLRADSSGAGDLRHLLSQH